MSIKKTITAAGATALMFALTACGGSAVSNQEVPANTDAPAATAAPSEEPVAVETPEPGAPTDNEFGVDVSQVVIGDDVKAAYGDEALTTLLPAALTVTSMAYNEPAELHVARDGSQDAAYLTDVFADRLTPEALTILTATPGEGQSGWLVPTVEADGSFEVRDGDEVIRRCEQVTEPGISAVLRGAPTVALWAGATAAEQQVQVDMPLTVTVHCDGGDDFTIERDLHTFFVPSAAGTWLLADWGHNTRLVGE